LTGLIRASSEIRAALSKAGGYQGLSQAPAQHFADAIIHAVERIALAIAGKIADSIDMDLR
jgi:hypothetical protein